LDGGLASEVGLGQEFAQPNMTTPPDVSVRGSLWLVMTVAAMGGFLFGYDTAVINGANQCLEDFFDLTPRQEGIAGAE
jgi:hypothetical protein